ncbi:MAG: type I restriction enzyme HsdR N-terminal domain-containing protein [Bacteroidota bacterium]|nr:type I restriction enzyme HsdR N-terminal domain-containing protein [Bacteroidota bacterium]
MIRLNLPDFKFKTRIADSHLQIFDPVRRKYVALTPEEWVRQHFIRYLNECKKVPLSHIAIEKSLQVNHLAKRADIIVFKGGAIPLLAVECKAPSVEVTEEVFHQLLRYNMTLKVEYLVVTNGLKHVYCKVDYALQKAVFIEELPLYDRL